MATTEQFSDYYSTYPQYGGNYLGNQYGYNHVQSTQYSADGWGQFYGSCDQQSADLTTNRHLNHPQFPVNADTFPPSTETFASQKDKVPQVENVEDSSASDSPTLRALLMRPPSKIKYTPNYFYSTTRNISNVTSSNTGYGQGKSFETAYQFYGQNVNPGTIPGQMSSQTAATQRMDNPTSYPSVILSPNRTEDSLDLMDAYRGKVSSHGYAKEGFEPTTQFHENAIMTPQTSPEGFVEVIGTPPLSPKEAGPVNQGESAQSSPNMIPPYSWIHSGKSLKIANNQARD